MKQPNSRYRRREDLPPVHREHYDVAKRLVGPFGRSQFMSMYRQLFPGRPPGSIQPADYCFDWGNKGNLDYPRFLQVDRTNGSRFSYRFVGLDGGGSPSC